MSYQTVNPFDNKLVKSFDEITDSQLEAKLAQASACFATWKTTSYAERAKVVARAAKLLHEQADRFAQLFRRRRGKIIDRE